MAYENLKSTTDPFDSTFDSAKDDKEDDKGSLLPRSLSIISIVRLEA